MAWYAATTASRCEHKAADGLNERGYEAYVPTEKHWTRHARKRTVSRRAIFPGYLFVRIEDGQCFYDARTSPGVSGFVGLMGSNSGPPGPIPYKWVYEIRESERAGFFDYTRENMPTFKNNDPVQIIGGPFAGQLATIMEAKPGAARVKVLFAALGRLSGQKAEISARQLDLVKDEKQPLAPARESAHTM